MKIIGMLPTYNEEEIIKEVIEHLISQGLEIVVLDNGSTDKTYDICKKFLGHGILKLQQFKSKTFNAFMNHRMLYDMAIEQSPDWLIRSDSDEFLESGVKNTTLNERITQVEKEGYNLIQFNRFDFFITDNDNKSSESIREEMPYYSCQGDYIYRSWKYFPGIRMGDTGGHYPIFPDEINYKIYPRKFVLRHYPFRNKKQAENKMKDRMRGTNFHKNNTQDVYGHYKKILKNDFSEKFDHTLLTKYREDNNWNLEIKFCPFVASNPPKRDDIFTKEGTLKNKQKTLLEYKRLLSTEHKKRLIAEQRNKIIVKNLRRVDSFKKIIKDKSKKIFGKNEGKET